MASEATTDVGIDPDKIRSVLATDCGSTTTKAILIEKNDKGEFGPSMWHLPASPKREFGGPADRANDPKKPDRRAANSPSQDGQYPKLAGESR